MIRAAIKLVMCLLLGVVSTVVVIAACLKVPGMIIPISPFDDSYWSTKGERTDGRWWHCKATRLGHQRIYSHYTPPDYEEFQSCFGGPPRPPFWEGDGVVDEGLDVFPSWRPALPEPKQTRHARTIHMHESAGFPFRCVTSGDGIPGESRGQYAIGRYEFHYTNRRGMLYLFMTDQRRLRLHLDMPSYPIASGLIGNTLAYGSVWWLVFLAPRRLRVAHRRRAGRCVKCKYDLTGIDADHPCPECGRVEDPRPQGDPQ